MAHKLTKHAHTAGGVTMRIRMFWDTKPVYTGFKPVWGKSEVSIVLHNIDKGFLAIKLVVYVPIVNNRFVSNELDQLPSVWDY